MALIYIVKLIFNSSTPNPTPAQRGKTLTGKPQDLAPHVYNDIVIIKQQLKQYETSFYTKIFKLVETNHSKQQKSLQQKYPNTNDSQYHQALFNLYKDHLQEYIDLLDLFKNNYTKTLYSNEIAKKQDGIIYSDCVSLINEKKAELAREQYEKLLEEAPENLLDPISFCLFEDPVITPSGITYEKCHLLSHLQRRGNYDPLSREPLFEDQLYPNLIVKDSVEEYKKSMIR
ncbi:STIP1 y and U box-containing protein 1 [Spathaspora sp. JA1]|nr:STIP1 y and U box-containing protein 1 [Spathaspora sp. JA1]